MNLNIKIRLNLYNCYRFGRDVTKIGAQGKRDIIVKLYN
jgi:hypothetical protein